MKTCLIVDDSDIDRIVICTMLERHGFFMLEAESGEEGLAACRERMPEVVVLDWEMDGISGIDFLKELRTMPGGDKVFVLMSTAKSRPSHVGHAYAAGADDYLIKPVTPLILAQKLEENGLSASGLASKKGGEAL